MDFKSGLPSEFSRPGSQGNLRSLHFHEYLGFWLSTVVSQFCLEGANSSVTQQFKFVRNNFNLSTGIILDEFSGIPLKNAVIHVDVISSSAPRPIAHDVTSGGDGDYWRLLVPGIYDVTASAPQFQNLTQRITVIDGPARRVGPRDSSSINDYNGIYRHPLNYRRTSLVRTQLERKSRSIVFFEKSRHSALCSIT